MASAVKKPATAFAAGAAVGQRDPRQKSEKHLAWLRTLPSVIPSSEIVEAAHVRFDDWSVGKRPTGKAEKPHDFWALPLGRDRHREQHSGSEQAFWRRYGLDPLRICLALWAYTQNDEVGRLIITAAHSSIRGNS